MVAKRSMWCLIILLGTLGWLLGLSAATSAETLNYKTYTYIVKSEKSFVGDAEGHAVILNVRRAFWVFENGETATSLATQGTDTTQGSGTMFQYVIITFADGSTIATKAQGTVTGTAPGVSTSTTFTGEILKGTGRFQGIKGTQTLKFKSFPLEKGEDASKAVGEGAFTYTLPPK
jgi:hypothetical protein